LEEAIVAYAQTLACNPLHIPALLNRGKCLLAKERYAEAEADFRKVVQLLPEHVEAQGGLACALIELEKPQPALAAADRAVAMEPTNWEWRMYRGKALLGLDRPQEALQDFERMGELGATPQNYFILMGSAYLDLNQMDKALDLYDQGARIDPTLAAWFYNRGVAFARLRRYEEAVAAYEEAIARDPTHAIAHWNCSLSMLIQGNPRGWELYEWRWKLPSGGPDPKSQPQAPRWNGHEDIKGKRLLLTAEQGLGDTLMFCRFAPLVTALGAQVDLAVHPGLVRLVGTLSDIETVMDRTKPIKIDLYSYYSPLMSLPRILNMSFDDIPFGGSAYLRCKPEWIDKWADIIGNATQNSSRPRVGLMWSGRKVKTLGVRSVTLPTLLGVLDPKFDFISLQKDLPKEDIELLKSFGIFHFGTEQSDLADAAAMIELCDVVVTIDTSIAHLAGALGKETWIMLQYDAEWRWLESRTDSPWYPKVRLFRQPRHGDWDSVIAEVKTALLERY
jgi:tetratricopeptide (TPR) repeat protein